MPLLGGRTAATYQQAQPVAATPFTGGTQIVSPPSGPSNPKIDTLTDDFATQDTAKWTFSTSSVIAGQLVIPCASNYPFAESVARYDLTGSSLYVQVVSTPAVGTGTTEMAAVLHIDGVNANALTFDVTGGLLYAGYAVAGVRTWAVSPTFDPVNHAFLRFRESGGTVYWETSADASSWSVLTSWTPAIPITGLKTHLYSGYYGTETAPGNAVFDNVNVAPTTVPVADTAAGSDAISVTGGVPTVDTGNGSDALAVAITTSSADAGSGTDAVTIASAVSLGDTAGGTDAVTVKAATTFADSGTGADALTVASAIPLADTGSGTDTLAAAVSTPLADTVSSADAVSVKASAPVTDAGAGAEALLVAAPNNPALPDTAIIADAVTVRSATPLVETATVTESFAVSVSVSLPDAATSVDAATAGASVGLSDAVTAAESFTLAAAVTLADAATVVDAATHTVGNPDRDITITVSQGRSRTLGVTATARTISAVGTASRTVTATGTSRELAAAGRSRTLTATPKE